MYTLQSVFDLMQRQDVEAEEVELSRSEFRSLAARIAEIASRDSGEEDE